MAVTQLKINNGMPKDYSNQNLQQVSFMNRDLSHSNFAGSDLRGANFTGSDLTGADFSNARMGIRTVNQVLIFIVTLLVSLLSGYIAMLAGFTIQRMLAYEDEKIKAAGYITIGIVLLFIVFYYWKGGSRTIRHLIIPTVILACVLGLISYFSGIGTGIGMIYLSVSLILVVIMFVVGTIARATAGTLSGILFVIVALSGGMFGKSVGGGVGTVIMAISCAMISKRALSGAKGFDLLRKTASSFTKKFGTSFRNANLTGAKFSQSKIHNTDFSNTDISLVNWNGARRVNCLHNGVFITDKKQKKNG